MIKIIGSCSWKLERIKYNTFKFLIVNFNLFLKFNLNKNNLFVLFEEIINLVMKD